MALSEAQTDYIRVRVNDHTGYEYVYASQGENVKGDQFALRYVGPDSVTHSVNTGEKNNHDWETDWNQFVAVVDDLIARMLKAVPPNWS